MFRYILKKRFSWKLDKPMIRVYPSSKSCVKADMKNVRVEQMPPLMTRKAEWRQ